MSRSNPSDAARDVIRSAARWLALLESGQASEQDHARLRQWREQDAAHEQAWQKAQHLRQRFAALPSGLAMAALDRPGATRRQVLKGALGALVLLPSAWLANRQWPLQTWGTDLRTAVGEQSRRVLADGSVLHLNTDSAANLDQTARQVTLIRGELGLRVPASATWRVETDYGRLEVSQADVCVRLAHDQCQVSVVAGSVQMSPLAGPRLTLLAGQQVDLSREGAGQARTFDAALPGWREAVLSVQDQPLGDLLRELSRYRPGLLRWDPTLERLRVTGSFRLDDTDRVLALLAATLPLEVQARTRYWVTLVPKGQGVAKKMT